jgi:hypothetical protein
MIGATNNKSTLMPQSPGHPDCIQNSYSGYNAHIIVALRQDFILKKEKAIPNPNAISQQIVVSKNIHIPIVLTA